MLPEQVRRPDEFCPILATVMAYGCNIGPYTMAQLTQNVSYRQIKQITDWQMTEEAQRQALAQVVNAISQLNVTQAWGAGKTSSSDGQRFRFKQRILQQTWSHRFYDYALEFYSFVADNYAPFYSTVIECTDRDAAYVLDGFLYNESDLMLEEHYTDTHGYTEINFAAFAMLGRRFSPRIRGIQLACLVFGKGRNAVAVQRAGIVGFGRHVQLTPGVGVTGAIAAAPQIS